MNDLDLIKSLTFYVGDKTDDELWAIVCEACRKSTTTWRAYERLRGNYQMMKLRENNDVCKEKESNQTR